MKRTLIVVVLLIIVGVLVFVIKFRKTNSPPAAMDGSFQTREDNPVAISLKGSDPDGDLLSCIILTKPSHGTLSGSEPNLIYTPEQNFSGADSFTFKVNDGKLDGSHAAINIMVTAVNDPPKANDDNVEINEDSSLVIINVLDNDTDIDKDKLTVLGSTGASHGSTIIGSDNKSITYNPNKDFSGADSFKYTISDGKGGTDSAAVRIKVITANDAPVIKSKPVTTTRVWGTYSYNVEATDPDIGDKLAYSLITKPEGMTINPATGLIQWKPNGTQAGTFDVEVKAQDSASEPASVNQKFSITVASLDSPLTLTLNVKEGYDSQNRKIPANDDKILNLRTSDDKRLEIAGSSFVCVFSDSNLPQGAVISSVDLHIEHFEDKGFPAGKMKWNIGTGWPQNAQIWDFTNAPLHEEKDKEAIDTWDITSDISTPEKLKSFQLQIDNSGSSQKTSIDNIYAIIRWY